MYPGYPSSRQDNTEHIQAGLRAVPSGKDFFLPEIALRFHIGAPQQSALSWQQDAQKDRSGENKK